MQVSLDGYVARSDEDIGMEPDEELHRYANEQAGEAGAFLYGRKLYELMHAYWPTADQSPDASEVEAEFARAYRDTPKVVVSRTLEEVGENCRLVKEDLAGEVARLKEEPGGDLQVGGPGLAASLIELDLIDAYEMWVHPVALGGGKPFFPAGRPLDLELADTRTFGSGVVLLRYERAA